MSKAPNKEEINSVVSHWQSLPGESWLLIDPLVVHTLEQDWFEAAPLDYIRQSLYLGTRHDSLGDHAPQLCQDHDGRWLSYLLEQWPDDPWGLALRSAVPVHELIHHLQSFITVYDPNGEEAMWRYQDPRIIAPTLKAFMPEERQIFLSPLYSLAAPNAQAELDIIHNTQQPAARVCYRQAPWLVFTQQYLDALSERNHRQRIRDFIIHLRTEIPYQVLDQSDEQLGLRIAHSWQIARTLWPRCDHPSEDRFALAHLQLPSHFYAHPECQQRLQHRGVTLSGLLGWANNIDWQPLWQQYHDPNWPRQADMQPFKPGQTNHTDTAFLSQQETQ